MITYAIILTILLILRLITDKILLWKYKTIKPLPKIIATGMCMVIAGTWVILHTSIWWHTVVTMIISSLAWAFVFDKLRNIINRKNPLYMSENTWPDKWILKYFNTPILYNFFLIVAIGFLWGMINNVSLKTKKR
jgi:Na+-transporting NADH:ubiquinone oxidoreductase subunit NqrB